MQCGGGEFGRLFKGTRDLKYVCVFDDVITHSQWYNHVFFFCWFWRSFLAATAGLFPVLFLVVLDPGTVRVPAEGGWGRAPRRRPDLVAVAPCHGLLERAGGLYCVASADGFDSAGCIRNFLPWRAFLSSLRASFAAFLVLNSTKAIPFPTNVLGSLTTLTASSKDSLPVPSPAMKKRMTSSSSIFTGKFPTNTLFVTSYRT